MPLRWYLRLLLLLQCQEPDQDGTRSESHECSDVTNGRQHGPDAATAARQASMNQASLNTKDLT